MLGRGPPKSSLTDSFSATVIGVFDVTEWRSVSITPPQEFPNGQALLNPLFKKNAIIGSRKVSHLNFPYHDVMIMSELLPSYSPSSVFSGTYEASRIIFIEICREKPYLSQLFISLNIQFQMTWSLGNSPAGPSSDPKMCTVMSEFKQVRYADSM